jgi:uncharacterized membrane protein
MIQSATGLVHTVVAVVALLSGLIIFVQPKATRAHRFLGYVYSSSMVVLIGTALSIYHLTHGPNVLHFFALVSIPPLAIGLSAAIRRRPAGTWLRTHYLGMSFSYLGLLSAFAAEMGTRLVMPYVAHHYGLHSPFLFWGVVAGVSTLIGAVGSSMIMRQEKRLMHLHKTWSTAPLRYDDPI